MILYLISKRHIVFNLAFSNGFRKNSTKTKEFAIRNLETKKGAFDIKKPILKLTQLESLPSFLSEYVSNNVAGILDQVKGLPISIWFPHLDGEAEILMDVVPKVNLLSNKYEITSLQGWTENDDLALVDFEIKIQNVILDVDLEPSIYADLKKTFLEKQLGFVKRSKKPHILRKKSDVYLKLRSNFKSKEYKVELLSCRIV